MPASSALFLMALASVMGEAFSKSKSLSATDPAQKAPAHSWLTSKVMCPPQQACTACETSDPMLE